MARINWGRLFIGSLIAAIIMFFTDGFIHETIAKSDWMAVYNGLRATMPEPHGTSVTELCTSTQPSSTHSPSSLN